MSWEVQLMEWLQANIPGPLILLISQFSAFGEEFALVAVMGFVYWCHDKEFGRKIGLLVCSSLILFPMIKNIVFRIRPYMEHSSIKCLRPVEPDADLMDVDAQGYSFPSGHSANAATVYPGIVIFGKNKNRLKLVLSIILMLLVGFSRVVVGCHYPTDVLCGWTLGLAMVFVISFLYKKIKNLNVIFAMVAVIGTIGVFYCKTSDFFSAYGILFGLWLSIPFEKKFVNFESTRNPVSSILRLVGGAVVFFALDEILKIPFGKEFLNSGTMVAHLVRSGRYMIAIFVSLAVYPMLFKFRIFSLEVPERREEVGDGIY